MIGKQKRAGKNQKVRSIKTIIATGRHRIDEIDRQIVRLYEDNFVERLSDESYSKMVAKYEQTKLRNPSAHGKKLMKLEREKADIRLLLAGLREYFNMEMLTSEVVNKINKRIEVHNSEQC